MEMLKKPVLFCSCGSYQYLNVCTTVPATLGQSSPSRGRVLFPSQHRRFAHIHGFGSPPSNEECPWPSSPIFSPYDIFKQDKNAPYSKRRFYDLVKIYHPDSASNGHPSCSGLSKAARMERYRLIIAAHEILSDPVKREAYDNHGHGWYQRTELFGNKAKTWNPRYGTRAPDDPIFRNATWEDWEEWYQTQQGRGETQTSDASHPTFASFIVISTLLVGVAHAITIGHFSSVQERVHEVNQKCTRFLDERKQETASQTNSPDSRVKHFLIRRDPSGHGLKEEETETYKRVFAPDHHAKAISSVDNLDATPQNSRNY